MKHSQSLTPSFICRLILLFEDYNSQKAMLGSLGVLGLSEDAAHQTSPWAEFRVLVTKDSAITASLRAGLPVFGNNWDPCAYLGVGLRRTRMAAGSGRSSPQVSSLWSGGGPLWVARRGRASVPHGAIREPWLPREVRPGPRGGGSGALCGRRRIPGAAGRQARPRRAEAGVCGKPCPGCEGSAGGRPPTAAALPICPGSQWSQSSTPASRSWWS